MKHHLHMVILLSLSISTQALQNTVFPTHPRKISGKILDPANIIETIALLSKPHHKIKCSMLCSATRNVKPTSYFVKGDSCELYKDLEVMDDPSSNSQPLEVSLKMSFETFNRLGMKSIPDLDKDILILRHDRTAGVFPSGQISVNADNSSASIYSILDQISNYEDGEGFFRFTLCCPERSAECFLWKQKDNPMDMTSQPSEANYVFESGPEEFNSEFRGLWKLDDSNTILNGQSGQSGWWFAMGQRHSFFGKIAAYLHTDGTGFSAMYLELYIRVPL